MHEALLTLLDCGFGVLDSILGALLKLRQACNDPRLLQPEAAVGPAPDGYSAKLDWLRERLPALVAEGRRMLVFSQFTRMLRLMQADLAALGLPWLTLTGDTPTARRGEVVARFQRGEAPLFLVSLKAGGVGLNLTAADYVFLLDPWWNPAVEAQAIDRTHRIGQTKEVFAYRLIAEDTVEEKVLALQQHKRALAEAVLSANPVGLRGLSKDDLDLLLS